MTTSKNSRHDPVSIALAALWAVIVIGSLIYITGSRLKLFDPEQKIYSEFSSTDLYFKSLTSVLPYTAVDGLLVLRVVDPKCNCNSGSQAHWLQLQQSYSSVAFQELDIFELEQSMVSLVPSTPMAIVIDEQLGVLYAGPFSDSNYCNSDNSLIEAYLSSDLDMKYAPMETKGCYCQTNLDA